MESSEIVLQIILGLCIVLLAAASLYLAALKIKVVPYTVFLLVAGIALSFLHIPFLEEVRLTPGTVLYVFLPILLFESAFNFKLRDFRKILTPAFLLSTVGLIICALVIALPLNLIFGIEFLHALLYACVISSTDPIAVLTIFKQVGINKRLQLLVDAESFLNDGTSVIAFRIILGFIGTGAATLSTDIAATGFANFIYVFFGGILIGAIFGFIFAQMISLIKNISSIEIILTIVLANVALIITDHFFKASGIIAVLAAGLVMGNYGRTKISPQAQEKMHMLWDFLVFTSTSIIFLLIGYEINLAAMIADLPIILAATGLLLLGRAISVYLVAGGYNLFTTAKKRIPLSWMHVANWGGLRGVLPLVVILSLPQDFLYRELFLNLVLGAILFTLIINTISIKKLIHVLKLDIVNKTDEIEIKLVEVLILEKLRHQVKDLLDLCEIGQKTYDKHITKINNAYNTVVDQLQEWMTSKIAKNYNEEAKVILKRYYLQVEHAKYTDLYNKEVISDRIYAALVDSIENIIDDLAEDKKVNFASLDKLDLEYEIRKVRTGLRYKLLAKFSLLPLHRIVKDSYLYHKARLVGNESVLHEISILANRKLEYINDVVLAEITSNYKQLYKRNKYIVDKLSEKYPEIIEQIDEQTFQCEVMAEVSEVLTKFGEQERISTKAISTLDLNV